MPDLLVGAYNTIYMIIFMTKNANFDATMKRTDTKSAPFDVEAVRRDFPILNQRIYDDKPLAYLDNAATSQKPVPVIRALVEYYEEYNANVHRALHYLGDQATARYEAARARAARFIRAPSERTLVFTRGTTESINLVAHAWGRKFVGEGDELIVTAMDHHSNLVPWQVLAAERGAKLHMVPVLENGTLDLEAYHVMLSSRTRLVAVTQMSNVLGTINPVKDIAAAAHAAGARVLVDGAQSVPHSPVDVQAIDCDWLAFSSHKMCGPTGAGVLYAKEELLEEMNPFMTGGEMISKVQDDHATWADLPYKFEAGTPNVAGAIGLAAAMDYLESIGMETIRRHEMELTDYALSRLGDVPGLRIFGCAPERGGAVSFEVEGIHPHDLSQVVDREGVAIRAGHLCAQPLMRRLGVTAVSRASLYLYNRPDEIDRLVEAILKAQAFFKHGS